MPLMETPDSPLTGTVPVVANPFDLRIKRGALWFYWIAALSLVTQVMYATGNSFGFIISLGITDVLGVVAHRSSSQAIQVVSSFVGFFILFTVAVCGYFAVRKSMAAFVVGLGILMLDSVLLLMSLPQGLFNLAIRVYAVYSIVGGILALRAEKAAASQPASPVVPPSL